MTKRRPKGRPLEEARSLIPPPATAAQPGRAAQAADTVVEGTCLVAVAVLPLVFSILGPAGFETEKANTLIVLACIATAAWIFGTVARGMGPVAVRSLDTLVGLGLLVIVSYCVATVFSISPGLSWHGTVERREGLETWAAYGVFFLCAATRLRHRRGVERLITVLIVSSLPAVVYGLLQQFGRDPLFSSGDPAVLQWPVRSTFGDHVFIGAFLVFAIPATAARLVEVYRRTPEGADRGVSEGPIAFLALLVAVPVSFMALLIGSRHVIATSVLFPFAFAGYALVGILLGELSFSVLMRRAQLWGYGLVLSLQVIVLGLTSARGAQLGGIAAVCVFVYLAARHLRQPRVERAVLLAAMAVGVILVALNIPNGPLESMRGVRGVGHIANLLSTTSPDSSVQGRLEVWRGVTDLIRTHPAIGTTWGGVGRDVIGYGPDTLRLAFEAVFPLELRRNTIEQYQVDRAHSIYLQLTTDAGLLALLTFLATLVFFFWRVRAALVRSPDALAWPLIGITAAIVGHLVEGIFGIETAVSLLLLWLFVGLVASPVFLHAEVDAVPSATPTAGKATAAYWVLVVVVACVFLLLGVGTDNPVLLATVWLLGIVTAVVGVSLALHTPPARPGATQKKRQRVNAPRRIDWKSPVTGGILSVVLAAALFYGFRNQAAIYANTEGSVEFSHGKPLGGISDAQLAARYAGFEPRYRVDFGRALLSLGLEQTAAGTLSLAGTPDPRSIDASTLLLLGRTALRDLGFRELREAVSLAPLNPTLHEGLGNALLQWGQAGAALREFERASLLSPNNPTYVGDQALAQIALRRPVVGLRLATTSVLLDEKYWFSRYALASAFDALKRRADAGEQAAIGLDLTILAYSPPTARQVTYLRRLSKNAPPPMIPGNFPLLVPI